MPTDDLGVSTDDLGVSTDKPTVSTDDSDVSCLFTDEEEVELYTCPKPLAFPFISKKPNASFTLGLGDMESWLKLMWSLLRHGIFSFGSNEESQYTERFVALYRIYQIDPEYLTKEHLEDFSEILDTMSVNPNAPCLLLLGDLLAGRQGVDFFTLKIYQKLFLAGRASEITISDGDMEFLIRYRRSQEALRAQQTREGPTGPQVRPRHFVTPQMSRDSSHQLVDPAYSATQLQTLIDRDFLTLETITEMVETTYLPSLQLCSYLVLEHPVDGKVMVVMLHAKINSLKDWGQRCCEHFGIPPSDFQTQTPEALQQSLDLLRWYFQRWVRTASADDLQEAMREGGFLHENTQGTEGELQDPPFAEILHGHSKGDSSLSDDFARDEGEGQRKTPRKYYAGRGTSPLTALNTHLSTLSTPASLRELTAALAQAKETIERFQTAHFPAAEHTATADPIELATTDPIELKRKQAFADLVEAIQTVEETLQTPPDTTEDNPALKRACAARALEHVETALLAADKACHQHRAEWKKTLLNVVILLSVVGFFWRFGRALQRNSWRKASFCQETRTGVFFEQQLGGLKSSLCNTTSTKSDSAEQQPTREADSTGPQPIAPVSTAP